MHQFDPTQGAASRVEGVETKHGLDEPFDGPMILLHEVIQIVALADRDGMISFFLE